MSTCVFFLTDQVSAEPRLRAALLMHCRGISIMEDEGRIGDHTAGIAATDGTWHHIAVTWSSQDGLATLYDNGHKVWQGNACVQGGPLYWCVESRM